MFSTGKIAKYSLPFIIAPLLGACLNLKSGAPYIIREGHYSENRGFGKCGDDFYSFIQKEVVDDKDNSVAHTYHRIKADAGFLDRKYLEKKLAEKENLDMLFDSEPFAVVPNSTENLKSDIIYIKRQSDGKFSLSTISKNPMVCDALWQYENS
jgi:hypothetical protein